MPAAARYEFRTEIDYNRWGQWRPVSEGATHVHFCEKIEFRIAPARTDEEIVKELRRIQLEVTSITRIKAIVEGNF